MYHFMSDTFELQRRNRQWVELAPTSLLQGTAVFATITIGGWTIGCGRKLRRRCFNSSIAKSFQLYHSLVFCSSSFASPRFTNNCIRLKIKLGLLHSTVPRSPPGFWDPSSWYLYVLWYCPKPQNKVTDLPFLVTLPPA